MIFSKKPKVAEPKQKVSIPWQIAGLYVPIPFIGLLCGIWVFWKIQKVSYGFLAAIVIFFLDIALAVLIASVLNNFLAIFIIAFLGTRIGLSFLIYRWSKQWNESIDKQNMQPSTTQV